jgi:hypothetical protein
MTGQHKIRTFGFQAEWRDFEKRNPLFLDKFDALVETFKETFPEESLEEPIDKFVRIYGRVCVEDFFEILLCAANGNGIAGQKLLRGLYERAVTVEYIHEHPDELEAFYDFHAVAQHKLKVAIERTMGKATFSQEMAQKIESDYNAVKSRFQVPDCETCGSTRPNHTWNRLDFVSMAGKTSLGLLIVPGYYVPLREAHATVASMLSRMVARPDGGADIASDAQRRDADIALRVSHNVMLCVLKVEKDHFPRLNLQAQYDARLQDFMDIWQKV